MRLLRRIKYLFRFGTEQRDLRREVEHHRQLIAEGYVRRGYSASDADAEARRVMGNQAYMREESRGVWLSPRIDMLIADLRYAWRGLWHAPGFTLVVTLTLALGIGATTAMFSIVNGVLLEPLAYPQAHALVAVNDVQQNQGGFPASFPEYTDWRDQTHDVFSDVGAIIGHGEVLSGSGDAEQLTGAMTSVNVLRMLGVTPILGRSFRADEEGANAPHVVMLGSALWHSHFGSDSSIIGRTITLTGVPYTVIGIYASDARAVLPSTTGGFAQRKPADFWEAINVTEKSSPRGFHYIDVIARLEPGVSFAAASGRVGTLSNVLKKERATANGTAITPLATALLGDLRAPLGLLLGAVALLLVVACANVANLLLARASTRRREFAVRAALGAGGGRVAAHVIVEGLVRAFVGGVCGVGVAYGLLAIGHRTLGATLPRMAEVTIDARVLIVAAALTALSGILFSVVPALRAARGDLVTDLRAGGRGLSDGARDLVRRALVVAEIAAASVVLTSGALLVRSLHNLMNVPTGFDAGHLVGARTWLPDSRYPDSLSQIRFDERLTAQMAAIFGASNASLASSLPVEGGTNGTIGVSGRTFAPGQEPMVEKRIVDNQYFGVIGAQLAQGRFFRAGDVLSAPAVAVVNQAFVRRWFPHQAVIGKQLSFQWNTSAVQTIVGVVADVREGALEAPAPPAVYVSAEQVPISFFSVVVRARRPLADVAAAYRSALRGLDPALPVLDVRRATDIVSSSADRRRFTTWILASFAFAALSLAAIGLFGLISYTVAQRTQELGVRAALGAQRNDLVALVLRQTAMWLAAGLAIGAVSSVAASRMLASQLFGVTRGDPWSFAASACLVALVALVASVLPSVRAARADPLEALRAS